MKVEFGTSAIDLPSPGFGYLEESSARPGDMDALRARFKRDGYLYLPGFIERETVLRARESVFAHMKEAEVLSPGTPVIEGVMPRGGKTVDLLGVNPVTTGTEVRAALEADELLEFFRRFYDEEPVGFPYKWLRAVGNERFTGVHFDSVYMGRGSSRVNTVWIPLGDIPIHQGTLAICAGSHDGPEFERLRSTYGKMDVDRDHTEGWFTESPQEILDLFGGKWLTTDFRAGDVLIFGLLTLHASTTNTTDRFRLSCDVRFQPGSDPVDERWGGTELSGNYEWGNSPQVSMREARERWGV